MSDAPERPAARAALAGIGFMCCAALVLPFMNASVKYLTASYPVAEIVWAAYQSGEDVDVSNLEVPPPA